jgi:hypothetical protein
MLNNCLFATYQPRNRPVLAIERFSGLWTGDSARVSVVGITLRY